MSGSLRVLIVGGYGTFGARLVALLATEPGLTLIVAGRSLARATAACERHASTDATLIPAMFDRDADAAAQLAAWRPDILVDASGPFQAYGTAPYRVIEACIAAGVHYLDLADGSDFVTGVRAFDEAARAAGLFVLSGVSSCPALTAAAVRRLSAGFIRIDTIHGGIAPSPFAEIGENVVRAIATHAGKPVALRRNGPAWSLTDHLSFTIAPPGHAPMRCRWFSLVDVPDLTVLPGLWPEVKTVWFGVGMALGISHRLLTGFAWLVRLGAIAGLSPLVPLMRFTMRHVRWGEHRGGMFVAIEGIDSSGRIAKRSWHLVADGDDGPFVPAMGVAAVIRRVISGQPPSPGARAAARDLDLDDYEPWFRQRAIHTGIRDDSTLYRRILGAAWDELPAEIRAMHDGVLSATGRASVERGNGLLAPLAAAIVGFPRATPDTPVSVRFDADRDTETWTRTFGGESFSSRQSAGRIVGRSREHFGPLTFTMTLQPQGERLLLVQRGWRIFGIPLPMWLCPRSNAYESVVEGRLHFHVEIGHPLTGMIVRYCGWLTPDPD